MTGQPPPEPGGDSSPARSGRVRKEPVKRVVLGTGETVVLAGYGQRFRARIADSLLIGIGLVFALIVWFGINLEWFLSDLDFYSEERPCGPPERPCRARSVWADSVFVPLLLYEIVAVAWRGRTLGMRTETIRVVSIHSGRAPSVFASLWRGALPVFVVSFSLYSDDWIFLSIPWWLLVHFSVLWGRDRRGWHDLLAGTVVVTSDPPEPPGGDAV